MFDANDLKVASGVQEIAAKDMRAQVRLVAGPGTGKSQTIEQRVGELLSQGVDPKEIAIISFTNASVRDLRERISVYCQKTKVKGARNLRVSTLHSLALTILKSAGLLEQFAFEPRVMSDFEMDVIHDQEFKLVSGIPLKKRREEIRSFMEAVWSTGDRNAPTYTPPDPKISVDEEQKFLAYHNPTSKVYCSVVPGEIVKLCVDQTTAGIISPADQLGLKFLIVDEYQDLSPVDLEFVDQMIAAGVNTFVAGDDDQSIYSFRHGAPVGIQTFNQKYDKAGMHILEHCFRCAPNVLDAAQTFIASVGIPNRIIKNPISMYASSNPSVGGTMHRWRFPNAAQEGASIASSCKKLKDADVDLNQILILVPNKGAFADIWPKLRDALTARGLAFEGLGDGGFLEQASGQLMLSMLKILNHRGSDGSPQHVIAHRLLYGLTKGVGTKACNELREFAINTVGTVYLDFFYKDLPSDLGSKGLEKARECCRRLKDIQIDDSIQSKKDELTSLTALLSDEDAAIGVRTYLEGFPELMSLKELYSYTTASTDEERWSILKAVFERLEQPVPEDSKLSEPKIKVMTLHGAKGLSAQVVFIVGLDEGVLPSDRQNTSTALLLESARLLFVAMTRARAACVLSTARTRYQNKVIQVNPSRWIAKTGGVLQNRDEGFSDVEVQAITADIRNL